MDYFVSAEDTSYHHWQLELLIESFKQHNLQDRLVVALANNPEHKFVTFGNNLQTLPRVFRHDNLGRKRDFLPLNRPYSLFLALSGNLVTLPLTLLDPDMVLVRPLPSPRDHVNFQLNPLFTLDFAQQHHCPVERHIRELLTLRHAEQDPSVHYWLPLGSVMMFQDVPNEFFSRTVEWTETLEYERRRESNVPWWYTEKAAWALTMLEYNGHLGYVPRHDLEMTLLDNKNHHFIHYQHGLPPVFHKLMFRYQPDGFAMGDVFDVALAQNPTTATNYFQRIVRSHLQVSTKVDTMPA